MIKKQRTCYVAISPDGETVFNCRSQTVFFSSTDSCIRAIKEELEEPSSEDVDRNIYTIADEFGYVVDDYRIFKEIKGGK